MSYDFSNINTQKNTITDWLKSEYRTIQTGRATPQVLDLVHIDMYGARTQIAHAGSVTIEDPRTIRVAPWDKSVIGQMEKAINDADLGLSVSSLSLIHIYRFLLRLFPGIYSLHTPTCMFE